MYRGFVDGDRAVLRMSGAAARDVLQGVVTNDVAKLAPGRAVYAALLTPQGKYMFDFFLLEDPFGGRDNAVLIDVARDRATALAQRLSMYCLRRDARITGATAFRVAPVWVSPGTGSPGAPRLPRPAAQVSMLVDDPRGLALGWRIYSEDAATVLRDAGVEMVDRSAYDALRVELVVPATGIELTEDTFILEAGFERLNGVDFRKGCYVGQEVTARMKHKTTLRRGMVAVAVDGDAPPGTPITADGKPAGTLFTVADGRGLAMLRLDRAGPGMEAGAARVDYAG